VDPRFGARNRRLEILCQATVVIEPSQRSFDNPATRQELEAGRVSSPFDNLDGPVTELAEGVTQDSAVLDAIGKEMAQPRKQPMDRVNDEPGAIAILDIGGVGFGTDQHTAGIGDNMAFVSFDLLGRIIAARPRRSRWF
jgi:hypothetical protein